VDFVGQRVILVSPLLSSQVQEIIVASGVKAALIGIGDCAGKGILFNTTI
jgi:hypothetical protein